MEINLYNIAVVHFTEFKLAREGEVDILKTTEDFIRLFPLTGKYTEESMAILSSIRTGHTLYVTFIKENTAEARIKALKVFEDKNLTIDFVADLQFTDVDYHIALAKLCEKRGDCVARLTVLHPTMWGKTTVEIKESCFGQKNLDKIGGPVEQI